MLRELNDNVKTLVRLNAIAIVSGRPQREQIHLLAQGGFSQAHAERATELIWSAPTCRRFGY